MMSDIPEVSVIWIRRTEDTDIVRIEQQLVGKFLQWLESPAFSLVVLFGPRWIVPVFSGLQATSRSPILDWKGM